VRSARWREVIEPLGWGDELRVALQVDGRTWGFLCLHREAGDQPFSEIDVERLAPVLPHLAAAFRRTSLAAQAVPSASVPLGPGVVLLDEEGRLVSATGSAQAWLQELAPLSTDALPLSILGLAAQVRAGEETSVLRLRSGQSSWVALHGGLLDGPGPARVAVVIEAAGAELTLPMLSATVGLTPREVDVTAAVIRGESTRTIAEQLRISEYTVQTHLKSIFAKTGVHSRRELVGRILAGR
jgi:DNA-binding CsgD family transcriptional regulator